MVNWGYMTIWLVAEPSPSRNQNIFSKMKANRGGNKDMTQPSRIYNPAKNGGTLKLL